MADVTISQLTQGSPSGGSLIPFSTGSSTLSVPASAILQNAGNIGIGASPDNNTKLTVRIKDNRSLGSTSLDGISLIRSDNAGTPSGIFFGQDTNASSDLYWENMVFNMNGGGSNFVFRVGNQTLLKIKKTGELVHPGVAKAWVNFNGLRDTAGNNNIDNTDRFIRASYNISRVKKQTNGYYTVYFNTPMNDANYVWQGTAGKTAGRNTTVEPVPDIAWNGTVLQTTSFDIFVWSSGGGYTGVSDEPFVMLTVFGN
jgi:hypothetical protein